VRSSIQTTAFLSSSCKSARRSGRAGPGELAGVDAPPLVGRPVASAGATRPRAGARLPRPNSPTLPWLRRRARSRSAIGWRHGTPAEGGAAGRPICQSIARRPGAPTPSLSRPGRSGSC